MVNEVSNKFCNRCHRILKDKKSIELGYGPSCYKKHLESQKVYLFDLSMEKFEKQVDNILDSMTSEELFNSLKENGLLL